MGGVVVSQALPVQLGWKRGEPLEELLEREWLVTNGLGGYAAGTVGGAATRRFHGKLIAALPAPLGRFMMLNHLEEWISSDSLQWRLSGDEHGDRPTAYPESEFLEEFVLEMGLPVWRFSKDGIRIEKRVVMPHQQNTTYIIYRLLEGPRNVRLHLRPSLKFRPHEGLLTESLPDSWSVRETGRELEISDGRDVPPLRIIIAGGGKLRREELELPNVIYRIERSRGYEWGGALWSPGIIEFDLEVGQTVGIVASVEPWDVVRALTIREAFEIECARREKMLSIAGRVAHESFGAQLVLSADQFLIRPGTRSADTARAIASGDEPRTVIAGYHWFTDWGRDTMISLEGLTLVTGRYREAGNILRTFATYIRNGLIPNMFPEGERGGLYHTADATMWFFHAVRRYVDTTSDRETLRVLLPKLIEIIDYHLAGTDFNIHVDPADGLLSQGAEGYQLTWMDAKVDGWVVTPRRGKAVEINALFYNALRILQQFLLDEGRTGESSRMEQLADRAQESFNRRFWYEEGQYLYDVIDPNDTAFRPNQIFAISLDHPVLERSRWAKVVAAAREKLVTPVGLRSLSRDHADYKPAYDGDLRSRDAAYHQGTVWGWLIGPFLDAWIRVHPGDREGALALLDGFRPHLSQACIGTISEVFDAEEPYKARGCAAQAWSVAEVLRCLRALS